MRRHLSGFLISAITCGLACSSTDPLHGSPGDGQQTGTSSAAITNNFAFGSAGWALVPGGGTTATPDAAVSFRGKLYVFAIGINDHGHYVKSFDGINWTDWSLIPGGGTAVVADNAVTFNGKLYLFGNGINDHGHYVNTFDGSVWSGWSAVPGSGTTLVSDATAVYNGKLYLFGIGINDHGHYVNTFDGGAWSGWSALPGGGTTLLPDSAVSYAGKLYVFGIGIGDHGQYVNTFDGTSWSGWSSVPGGQRTLVADSATAYAGNLYLFGLNAADGTPTFNVFDGSNWQGWSPVPGGGAANVSLASAVYKDNLYLFSVGEDDQHYFQTASIHGPLPPYNEVAFQTTHNSYWVKRDNVVEAEASGTQERLLDQVLFEGVRGWELDLHHDNTTAHNFTVYHTSMPSNSLCPNLGDCLQNLLDFQYALPDHDPFTLVFELKEVTSEQMFSADHTPADLDAIIETYLGPYLYRPRDLLARCGGTGTMRDCAKNGWPTLDQLRGKFLAVIIGNYDGEAPKVDTTCISPVLAHNGLAWVNYGTGPGGAAARTAFLMESPWMTPYIACQEGISQRLVGQAVADAPFVQVEWGGGTGVMQVPWVQADVQANIVTRVDYGGQNEPTFAAQAEIVAGAGNLIQNDHPWYNVNGASPLRVAIPSPRAAVRDATALNEPGERILLKELASGGSATVPQSFLTRPSARWETTVSSTRPATDPVVSGDPFSPNPMLPRGSGCLYASTASDANGKFQNGVRVCRTTANGHWNVSKPLGEDVIINVDVVTNGTTKTTTYYSDDRDSGGFGEMLRLDLSQSSTQNACVSVYSSEALLGPVVNWHPLQTSCFATTFPEQGLAAHDGDVLFVNTKHAWSNAATAPLVATDSFHAPYSLKPGYAVLDVSWPKAYPDATCSPDVTGGCAVPVHRSYGGSSEGHFYSTDIREASSWGYLVEGANYFYLEASQLTGRTPFYRCYSASVNRRFYTVDASCEGFGSVEEVLGQIATSPLAGTIPLYRLYSSKASDHLYTTSVAEISSAQSSGYVYESVAGYVWPASSIQ